MAVEENSRVCCCSSKLIIRQWLINETWPDIRYKIFDKIFVNVGCGPVIHHSTGSTTVYFSTVSNTRPDFSCMRHCFKLLEHDCRKKKSFVSDSHVGIILPIIPFSLFCITNSIETLESEFQFHQSLPCDCQNGKLI